MVFQHLASRVGLVARAHGASPDASSDTPNDAVLRVHAVAEEEGQIGCEIVDTHATREVVLGDSKAVGQRKGELGDRVRSCLGDVVPGNRNRVEIANVVVDEELLDVAHHAEGELGVEDTGVLGLILLQDVSLDGPAHDLQCVGLDALVCFSIDEILACDAEQT